VVQRRRCGKPNCHCAEGEELHEATVLNYSEGGRTRAVMLPPEQVGQVRAAVARYRAALAALEKEGNAGLAVLAEAWGARRARQGAPPPPPSSAARRRSSA
jgi:hypothetical protein